MSIERPEVRVEPNRYQPSKAEVEEVFGPPHKADGSPCTVNEAIRTIVQPVQPVQVVEDPEA